jgi:hypothetical protein
MNNPIKEAVNHPSHYNKIQGVECIDVVEQMSFSLGNAVKYIWRCEEKGNKVQDLKKAIWYLNREISKTLKLKKNKTKQNELRAGKTKQHRSRNKQKLQPAARSSRQRGA